MKKINVLVFGCLAMISNLVIAQQAERTSAWNYLKEGELGKAKESIDKAIKHEATMNDPKTWNFKGLIYGQLALSDKDEFKKLVENPLDEAYAAIKKSMELDTKGLSKEDNNRVLREVIITAYFNRGVTIYNIANELGSDTIKAVNNIKIGYSINLCQYLLVLPDNVVKTTEGTKETEVWNFGTSSLTFINGILSINSGIPSTTFKKISSPLTEKSFYTLALKDFDTFWEIFAKLGNDQYYIIAYLEENKIKLSAIRLYTGYCAKMVGDKEKAKTQFSQTVNIKADDVTAKKEQEPVYYIQYSNILNDLGYFIEATEVIERGRAIWPDNKNLTLTELKIYQDAGKISELAEKLKTALETDPTNLNLNATYAGTLDLISKSCSDKGDSANSSKYLALSAAAYKVAIEMTKKYKDEVKYRVNGKATSYEITYINENGEKKKEVVVAGWEYPFTAKDGMNLSLNATGKEKKVEVIATILLAGNILMEGISDQTKNSNAIATATISKDEIDKNNNLYDLYYNLGVLYFNPGVDVYNVWANSSDEKELGKLEKKFMNYFEKALPYIEEAHALRPSEKTTMQVLLNIYLRKKDNEKAKKIQDELKSLKKQ